MEIVLATENLHKIREFRELFKQLPQFDILSLRNFSDYTPPEEKGKTFDENAKLKASHAAQHLNKCVLADDSGLVIPALNGEPGVLSRRYAGEEATDVENRQKLIEKLQKLEDFQHAAYFECALVFIHPNGQKKSVTAQVEGIVIDEERGSQGFGYDSLFIKNDYDLTFAEITESTKNRISHRYKAFHKLLPLLESLKE